MSCLEDLESQLGPEGELRGDVLAPHPDDALRNVRWAAWTRQAAEHFGAGVDDTEAPGLEVSQRRQGEGTEPAVVETMLTE